MLIRILRRLVLALLRPLPIVCEWLFTNQSFVVEIYPIAALLLALSAVPVHRKLFKSGFNNKVNVSGYNDAIGSLVLIFSALAFLCLLSIWSELLFVLTVVCLFVVEKAADEYLRALNYKKKMYLWELIQLIRAGWLVPVVIVGILLGPQNYVLWLSVAISAAALVTVVTVIVKLDLSDKFVLYRNSVKLIWTEFPYLSGSVLSGAVRQLPRIVVTQFFEQYSHVYMIVSQITQIIPVLYNVIFQVPYRKIMARKYNLYYLSIQSVNRRILLLAVVVFLVTALVYWSLGYYEIFFFILVSEALVYAVLSNTLGLYVWKCSSKDVFNNYFLLMVIWLALVAPVIYLIMLSSYDDLVKFMLILQAQFCALFSISLICTKRFES